jgi:broad specificity phosphatase PhoE
LSIGPETTALLKTHGLTFFTRLRAIFLHCMTKTIYIVRHGETDLNKLGMVQGRGVDSPLNDTGRMQAQAIFERLRHVPFDKIYTSTLRRTHQTVEPFHQLNIPMEALGGFDEISWGEQEGQVFTPESETAYQQMVKQWNAGHLDVCVPGGETPLEVQIRQQPAMESVLKTDGNTLLICMHGRAMRILLCWLLNYPLRFMENFPHHNGTCYQLEWLHGSFVMRRFNMKVNV